MPNIKIQPQGAAEAIELSSTGDFYQLLNFVKDTFPGCRMSDQRVWHLPNHTLDEVRRLAAEEGFQVIASVMDRVEAVTSEIHSLLEWIGWYRAEIEFQADANWAAAQGYSYNSRSRIKAGHMRDAGCLKHALKAAQKPAEELTQPEIAGMRRALEIIKNAPSIPLLTWLRHLKRTPRTSGEPATWQVPRNSIRYHDVPKQEVPGMGEVCNFDLYIVDIAAPKLETTHHFLPKIREAYAVDPNGETQQVLMFEFS